MVNIPLAAGSGGEKFREAVSQFWLPRWKDSNRRCCLFPPASTRIRDDDLASLNLLEADYAWVTEKIREIAQKYADGRIVSALEGGYALPALGRSVAAHLKVLSDAIDRDYPQNCRTASFRMGFSTNSYLR